MNRGNHSKANSKMESVTPALAQELLTRVCASRATGLVSKISGADTLIIYDTRHDTCIRIASPQETSRVVVQAPAHVLIIRERLLIRIASGDLRAVAAVDAQAGAA